MRVSYNNHSRRETPGYAIKTATMQPNNSELLARYEKALKDHTNCYFDADDFDEIAFQYEITERYKDALDAVERGLSVHPDNINLATKQAKYLLYLDRTDEVRNLISNLPIESCETILIKAELALIDLDPDTAKLFIYSLFDIDGFSIDYCFEILDLFIDYGYMEELPGFIALVSVTFKDDREFLQEAALIYEEKEEYSKAAEIYNRLLDKDPYSYEDWINLAKIYALLKDFPKAVDACDFALTSKENDEGALSFKGYCLYDLEDYTGAIETFKEFSRQVDEKSVAYELIAECYIKLEQNAMAITYLNMAYELNPESPNICYQLAANHYDMGNTPMCIEFLNKTISLNPEDADALSFLGEISLNDSKTDEALGYFLKALSFDPTNASILTYLGDISTTKNNQTDAVGYYEKALQTEPFDVKLMFKLILAHYNSGNQEKAANLIKHLDEVTLQVDDLSEISDDNRTEILKAKEMLDKLKNILRNHLNEDI